MSYKKQFIRNTSRISWKNKKQALVSLKNSRNITLAKISTFLSSANQTPSIWYYFSQQRRKMMEMDLLHLYVVIFLKNCQENLKDLEK